MRITVICADLSGNGLGRAILLADMLGRRHEVELVGTMFGAGAWEPARGRTFHRVVQGRRWPAYLLPATRLLAGVRGDVVYAVKPLPSSFGLALVHRARTGTPVVLDIDDEELAFAPPPPRWDVVRRAAAFTVPNGRPWVALAGSQAHRADAVTVASGGLQARHGGTLIPHAKDTEILRPDRGSREAGLRLLGLDDGRTVLFAGTPRPFKGIEDAAAAVGRMRNDARLVVAGADPTDPYVERLQREHPGVVFRPPFPSQELPHVLAAADAVVVPQRMDARTAHQLPSKLLDAMAMARPVVATAVSDIPHILGSDRGHVVPPGDVAALARSLDRIVGDTEGAAEMGARARAWCVAHASFDAVATRLDQVFEDVVRRG